VAATPLTYSINNKKITNTMIKEIIIRDFFSFKGEYKIVLNPTINVLLGSNGQRAKVRYGKLKTAPGLLDCLKTVQLKENDSEVDRFCQTVS
jgi:hypothetical protein